MAAGRTRLLAALAGTAVGFAGALGGLMIAQGAPGECRPADSPYSVARQWDEAALDAVRRDLPAPTVHARNLFHLSVAMWDAWAAYDISARGYLVDEDRTARDVAAARDEAISYAAYRVLESRYLTATGASDSIPQLDALMDSLCHPTDVTGTEGDSPAELGNLIAAQVLAAGSADGSREADGYTDPEYQPVNDPLVVDQPGAEMVDPNRWQPLQIEQMVSQNGIPVADGVQQFIGPYWGQVTGFALPDAGPAGLPLDPGRPPLLGDPATDEAFKKAALEVIGFSALLDPSDGAEVDISPGSLGANPLDGYDGTGHQVNPVTGQPYASNVVPRADFARVLAEFWADGPDSETPPGHWNTIANGVSDALDPDLRISGTGPRVDRLQWDVSMYLALNGATHDAAVAAWGAKGHYDYSRPISMIRFMGGQGQSSDPDGPSYDPEGLPLQAGLVEVVTARTTAAGQRHESLRGHEGEIAVRSWAGRPDDTESDVGGVGWIRAVEWIPYQLPTFVTPSFAGYVSGHSAFSRAAAEVLTGFTGSPYFPGGLGEQRIRSDSLEFEAGPSDDVVLQWATYADAADQAGLSRLYGGIHVRADDLNGRLVGEKCGRAAWAKAQEYYGGGST
ncbi:MAG: vanadium-dependent haloperoxidase [Jiangellales bacterium]